jgi:predicted site-specific integrase-resolvase
MSANLASDPNALTRTLTMLSQPETAVVRQGEKLLKPFLKQTSCILPLINQIRSNPDEAVRHHAALLLKRRISVLYGKLSAPQKQDLKLQILTLMISEPSKSVGVALAGVVASVAKCVLTTEHQWPELFGMLLQLSADPKESMRSLNYSLLEQVIGTCYCDFVVVCCVVLIV